MKIFLIIITLFLFSLNVANAGSSYMVQCPGKIAVTQNISNKYPGWRSITTQPNHYLRGVTLFSGKPEEMASLVPDSSKQDKSTWTFSANEQIYISCEYNETSIQLTQALPAHTASCSIFYD